MDSVANIILYFVVAAIIVVFSIMTVTSRRILRSATYLLFVLIGTALFYFQLGYQFLGESLAGSIEAGQMITMQDIGHAMLGTDRFQYLLPFEAVSVLLLSCIIGGVVVARKR